MKSCTVIGSDKGGVGKSLLAQLVITAHDLAFEEARLVRGDVGTSRLKVVEIDFQHRLRDVLGDRVNLSLEATVLDASTQSGLMSHFNKAYDVWASGDSLTDLGGNVTTPLFAWARSHEIRKYAEEDDIAFRFVAVMSPDDLALRAGFQSLKGAKEAFGERTELFLVTNDTIGQSGFGHLRATDAWRMMERTAQDNGVTIINIPFCRSEMMDIARAKGHTISDLLNNGAEIATKAAGDGDRLSARMQARDFVNWIKDVQAALLPLFSKPPGRREA